MIWLSWITRAPSLFEWSNGAIEDGKIQGCFSKGKRQDIPYLVTTTSEKWGWGGVGSVISSYTLEEKKVTKTFYSIWGVGLGY